MPDEDSPPELPPKLCTTCSSPMTKLPAMGAEAYSCEQCAKAPFTTTQVNELEALAMRCQQSLGPPLDRSGVEYFLILRATARDGDTWCTHIGNTLDRAHQVKVLEEMAAAIKAGIDAPPSGLEEPAERLN